MNTSLAVRGLAVLALFAAIGMLLLLPEVQPRLKKYVSPFDGDLLHPLLRRPQPAVTTLAEVITDTNYTLLYNGTWMVQLYQGSHCYFSTKFEPVWNKIVKDGRIQNDTVRFAQIDVHYNTVAATVLEVKSLPSLKL
eukprot:jgi/Hompol1/5420/HPOL_004421-RA